LLAKINGSNLSFQGQIRRFKRLNELGRVKTRERGGTNESSLGQGNLAMIFESMLGAKIHGSEVGAKLHGSELGVKICGSEVPATSAPPRLPCYARPGTSTSVVAPRLVTSEPCVLAPTPRVQRSVYVTQGAKRNFF